MARGQTVAYEITGNSKGLVSAAASGAASFDKLGAAAARSTSRAGQFADAIGKTSTTMARSATAFGLPIGPLRLLDDAADIAEIGFKNLTTAAAGFSAASVGVAGAGLAIGAALGTLAVKLAESEFGMKTLGLSIKGLDADMRKLYDSVFGGPATGPAKAGWLEGVQAAFANVQANVAVNEIGHWRKVVEEAQAAGLSIDRIREIYGDKLPKAIDDWLKSTDKAADAHAKSVDKAKQSLSELLNFQERVTAGVTASIAAMFDVQGVAFGNAAALADGFVDPRMVEPMQRGPNLSGVMGAFARGEIGTGAQAADDATRAGIDFSKMLGDVAHAFQLLGVGPGSTLGKFVGSLTVIGAGIDNIIKGSKQGGISGALSMATGVLGVAAAGFSLVKGLFGGGGPSKEELAAKKAEEEKERARISAAAATMRARGIESLAATGGAFFAGRRPAPGTVMSPDDARRQGTLFAAAWGTVVKEKGIVAAADAFGEAFKNMKADFEAAGIEPPAWFKEISGQVDLGLDEGFRNVAEAAQTAAQFLLAFAEAGGVLNEETMAAFEQEARAAFGGGKQAALNLGQGEEQAVKAGFAAANPLLRGLLDQSIVQGVALSADIQAMIDAAGIVPSEIVQQLDELRAIRKAVEQLAGMGAINGGNGNVFGIPRDLPEFQRGGDTDRVREGAGGGGFPAILHPNETVVPDEDIPDFVRAHGGSTNAGSIEAALASLAAEVRGGRDRPITINVPPPDLRGAIIPRGGEDVIVERAAREFARQITQGGPIFQALARRLEDRFAKK